MKIVTVTSVVFNYSPYPMEALLGRARSSNYLPPSISLFLIYRK